MTGSQVRRKKASSLLNPDLINRMQHGILAYKYKGIEMFKCPFDLAIYTELLFDLKPRTVIELGSWSGGSALWLADMLQVLGLSDTVLYSLDIKPVTNLHDARIKFGKCDTNDLEATLSDALMRSLAHPLLVIDDASHNYHQVLKALEFFDRYLIAGDYLVVEDGVASIVDAEELNNFDGGPFQALHTFLELHPQSYQIDRARCDFYGENVTWSTDGYIKRIA